MYSADFAAKPDTAALLARLEAVRVRIRSGCLKAGRAPEAVRLIAVGKTYPDTDIAALYEAGQRDFGENYIQEWQHKATALRGACPDIVWHIIGHIQSNKTRAVAEGAAWVHSVDSLKTAQRLSAQRPESLPPLNVCLEVNIGAEAQKHGIAPADVLALAQAVAALPRLKLRGLMCVPEAQADDAVLRQRFEAMSQLLDTLRDHGLAVDTLSMGMSADLETAIACGATAVRIGTALFGPRRYPA